MNCHLQLENDINKILVSSRNRIARNLSISIWRYKTLESMVTLVLRYLGGQYIDDAAVVSQFGTDGDKFLAIWRGKLAKILIPRSNRQARYPRAKLSYERSNVNEARKFECRYNNSGCLASRGQKSSSEEAFPAPERCDVHSLFNMSAPRSK